MNRVGNGPVRMSAREIGVLSKHNQASLTVSHKRLRNETQVQLMFWLNTLIERHHESVICPQDIRLFRRKVNPRVTHAQSGLACLPQHAPGQGTNQESGSGFDGP